jgi:hypothetical protein
MFALGDHRAAAGVILCVGWLTLALQLGDMFESSQLHHQQQQQEETEQDDQELKGGSLRLTSKDSDLTHLHHGGSVTSLLGEGVTPFGSLASRSDLTPTVYDLETGSDNGAEPGAAAGFGGATGEQVVAGVREDQHTMETCDDQVQNSSGLAAVHSQAVTL